jgi:Big-like domain-containing protein/concanavalin A-like lectin/glucanase superfamily protein
MPWIEPVGLNVQWSSDMPSVYLSTVAVSAATADLSTNVTITVTVKDAQGVPMKDIVVVLSATGTGNTLTQPAAVTDANGVATGTLSSSVAGDKVITATIDGLLIEQTASVTVESQAFSPDDLAGLELWLAADAIVGPADADPVTTWEDESGNGRDATQETAGEKPTYRTGVLNGKPVVRFDGGDLLEITPFFTGFTAGTIFTVVKIVADPTAGTIDGHPINIFGSDLEHSFYPISGGVDVYDTFGTTARKQLGDLTPSLAAWRIYNAISAANDWRAYLDGTLVFSTVTNTVGWNDGAVLPVLIGASRRSVAEGARTLDGDIAEIIMYSRALSDTERQQVEDYLMDKYGL